jgi:tripartite-type tricarboxylate transporter receptor subunit TctC
MRPSGQAQTHDRNAPAGTPRDIVNKLHGSRHEVLTMPDVRERILGAGLDPATIASPEEFAALSAPRPIREPRPSRRLE